MQYKEVAGGICAPKGFAAAGVHCGIRANHAEKYDLALIKVVVKSPTEFCNAEEEIHKRTYRSKADLLL